MKSPWRFLVQPVSCWRELADGSPLAPVISSQILLSVLGALLASRPYSVLAEDFGLGRLPVAGGFFALVTLLITAALTVLAIDLLWAALLSVAGLIVGSRIAPRRAFTLAAYSLLPVVLGTALGQLVLAISQYVPTDRSEALALRLRPFPFSLAAFPAAGIEPLSISWFFLAYFDLFLLWGLAVLWLGLRHYERLTPRASSWILSALVLLLALGLTGLWKGVQTVMAS